MADPKAEPETDPPGDAPSLSVTAEIVAFAPGLYCIDMPAAAGAASLPYGRLQPVSGGFASTLAETGFLLPAGEPAFLRVPGPEPARVLITLYAADGALAPELRVRPLDAQAARPAAKAAAPAQSALVLVYVQGTGDATAPLAAWAGRPGSGQPLEGFAVTPGAPLPADSIEYQGSLGAEWDTDWHPAGTFCGTRDVALPLIGLRIRITGRAAERMGCLYWGSFIGQGERGPFSDGELCACNGAPLEALRVEFRSLA